MKSRVPEIVEPKQLVQPRVLVKRARLTVKQSAARPNGKSKPPQSPLRGIEHEAQPGIRHKTTKEEDGGEPPRWCDPTIYVEGTGPEGSPVSELNQRQSITMDP